MDYQTILRNIKPSHEFFIGIDSDGCVFDSMEVKQKEFFIPNALKYFDLYPISKVLRETWEFVNLYSIYRGGNRFSSIIKVTYNSKGIPIISEARNSKPKKVKEIRIKFSVIFLTILSLAILIIPVNTFVANSIIHFLYILLNSSTYLGLLLTFLKLSAFAFIAFLGFGAVYLQRIT